MQTRKTGLFIFFLIIHLNIKACDICGCTALGMSGGLFPQIQNNLFGIRYMPVTLTHSNSFNGANNRVFKDVYHDAEFFFRWYPSKRLQLWFNVPYKVHIREEAVRTTQLQGLGDIQVNAFYSLFQTPDSVPRNIRHLLLAGAGAGMPTGKYQQRDESLTTLPLNFQTGTGAWSLRTTILYLIRLNRIGAQLQGDFQVFTRNENEFQRGNQAGGQVQVFYRFPLKRGLLLPQVGLRQESLQRDNEYGQRKIDSGGYSSWGVMSLDWYGRSWMLGAAVQLPVQVVVNGNQPTSSLRLGLAAGIIW